MLLLILASNRREISSLITIRTNNSNELCFRWNVSLAHISLLDLLKVTFNDSLLVHEGMNEVRGLSSFISEVVHRFGFDHTNLLHYFNRFGDTLLKYQI